MRALARAQTIPGGTNLKAWLFTILRNAFYEQARRRRTEMTALERAGPTEQATAPHQEVRRHSGTFTA